MICRVAFIALVVLVIATTISAAIENPMEFFKTPEQFKAHHADHLRSELSKHTASGKSVESFWPSTISSLNVTAFLGRWYQVYGNWIVLHTFSNNSECATATYGPVDTSYNPPRVGVFNWERQYAITGPVRNITGYAFQKDAATYPGRLDVTLDGAGVNAPYWIYDSSPVVNGQYQWILVSDELHATLFILCRDVQEFEQKYETEVLQIAANRGFKGFNKPVKVPQSPNCRYNQYP